LTRIFFYYNFAHIHNTKTARTMKTYCTIKTPQHADGRVHHYHIQTGWFDDETMMFTPSKPYVGGNHSVQFIDVEQWRECRILEPRRLQFIFWNHERPCIAFNRYRVGDHHALAFQLIYNWSFYFLWWEVRQFKSEPERDAALALYVRNEKQ